jgi:hypothetical protein
MTLFWMTLEGNGLHKVCGTVQYDDSCFWVWWKHTYFEPGRNPAVTRPVKSFSGIAGYFVTALMPE